MSSARDVVYFALFRAAAIRLPGMTGRFARAGDLSAVPGVLTPGTAGKSAWQALRRAMLRGYQMPYHGTNHDGTGIHSRHAANSG
jgi:hypothetical protein